jgi:hypothetical protein
MSDVPPLPELTSHRRHWLEYVATAAALAISAISLWVAVGTMDANNKMVAASSWPFLQVTTSDSTPDGKSELIFEIGNAGVGPALVEYFEISLDGKPLRTSGELFQRCCGFDPRTPRPVAIHQPSIGSWTEGTVGGSVIRAGESRVFLRYPKTADNDRAWNIVRTAISSQRLEVRACYCSVFNECWQSAYVGIHPTRVDKCVAPKVSYAE